MEEIKMWVESDSFLPLDTHESQHRDKIIYE